MPMNMVTEYARAAAMPPTKNQNVSSRIIHCEEAAHIALDNVSDVK
jgi:hypothetical protein